MISIVIRTKNEADNLECCIKQLMKQTMKNEIIIVDSHSTDNTPDIVERYNCILVQCDDPFSYGRALNMGLGRTSSRYVCILSSHCFPKGKQFLYNMWQNFKDKTVAGVYARQIPHRFTNPVEYRNFLHIYGNERIIQCCSPLFNNGASMIDKKVWRDIRFDETVVAQEDMLWAKQVIDNGYKIVYEPGSIVEHLHNENLLQTVSRYEIETRALQKMRFIEW